MKAKRSEKRETALVTGASEGIGRELARTFAGEGFDVVLVARNAERLEELAGELALRHGVRALPIPRDLSKPDAPVALFEQLARRDVHVDVLVNNAGLLEFGRFAEAPPDRLAALLELNVVALTLMTRQFLPPMLAAKHGRVLNVGSVGSFLPMPSLAAYGASKAFILSFSEALSEELRGTGVRVSVCCPGFTETHMAHQIEGVERLEGIAPLMDPVEVARAAYAACIAGEVVCVPGLANQIAIGALGLQPRWLVRRLGGLIGRRAM
jgi:short-subunit dehydrogenase